jgi:cytochrome c oxidase subunit 2
VLLAIAAVLVVAINVALVAMVVRFRAARGREPRRLKTRRPPQLAAGAAFAVLAVAVLVAGIVYTESASDVEASGSEGLQAAANTTAQRGISLPAGDETAPLQIEATGQQWIWRYQYPDGTFSYYELVVPVDTAVVIKLDSTDVVHRWWVPGLGGKFDAVPGEANSTWFKADEEGEYEGQSYAFSGPAYAVMRTKVRVVSVTEYEAFLEEQAAGIQEAQADVQARVAGATPGTETAAETEAGQ